VRNAVQVKLVEQDGELYILAAQWGPSRRVALSRMALCGGQCLTRTLSHCHTVANVDLER
jgi:hypothetical protein